MDEAGGETLATAVARPTGGALWAGAGLWGSASGGNGLPYTRGWGAAIDCGKPAGSAGGTIRLAIGTEADAETPLVTPAGAAACGAGLAGPAGLPYGPAGSGAGVGRGPAAYPVCGDAGAT
ncbi:MAG TPA: hypothetical protein VFR67_00585 [Pilimelia sp.]|nr:hypothetical protein [Pilimelia sp.]